MTAKRIDRPSAVLRRELDEPVAASVAVPDAGEPGAWVPPSADEAVPVVGVGPAVTDPAGSLRAGGTLPTVTVIAAPLGCAIACPQLSSCGT
ncbi:hypothetical protein GCM10009635_09410 [Actinocatenispora thailandica]